MELLLKAMINITHSFYFANFHTFGLYYMHVCTTSLHICIIHQRPYYKSMYCSLVIYVCVGWGGKFICDWLVGSCILRIPQYIFRRQVDGWVGFGYLSVWYVRIYSF